MKNLIVAALSAILMLSTAQAADVPKILGTLKNKGGGEIVLTTEPCPNSTGTFFLFTNGDGGEIGFTGCWKYIKPYVFATYSDGTVYTYPVEAVHFSSDPRWNKSGTRNPNGT